MITSIRNNFLLVTLPEIPCDKLLEYTNVLKLCTMLEKGLTKEQLDETLFVFANTDTRYPMRENYVNEVDTNGYKHKVLIWFGEESGAIPSDAILKKYDFTLKAYMKKEYKDKSLFSLPLILPGEVPECDIVPFNERKYNVFFSGNLNCNRVPLYVEINKNSAWWEKMLLPFYGHKGGARLLKIVYGGKEFDLSDQLAHSIVRFNNGFNKGFSKQEYASITASSKIILSPRGFTSTECFRVYEAMRQGCVVVSEELPHTSIYKDIPIVQVKNWKNILTIIAELLADEKKMNDISAASIKYYHDNLSLEAIAKDVVRRVKNLD